MKNPISNGARSSLLLIACLASASPSTALAAKRSVKDADTSVGKGASPATAASPAATGTSGATAPAAAASGTAATAPAPVAAPKPKAATYEELREGAEDPGDLGQLLEPLFATCNQTEPLAHRRCELIRKWDVERVQKTRWVSVADPSALQPQPYDADAHSITLAVNGCLSCEDPPTVDGARRMLYTRQPKSLEHGAGSSVVPVGLDLSFYEVPVATAEKSTRYLASVLPRLRAEMVYTVGQPVLNGAAQGVAITALGHRVYNRCSGEVVGAAPPSHGNVVIRHRDPSCPPPGALSDDEAEEVRFQASLPRTLDRAIIEKTMVPVQKRVFDCGEAYDLHGVAEVRVIVHGDGKNEITILPPYNEGEVHLCLRAAVNEAKFPRFKSASPPVKVNYPFILRNQ